MARGRSRRRVGRRLLPTKPRLLPRRTLRLRRSGCGSVKCAAHRPQKTMRTLYRRIEVRLPRVVRALRLLLGAGAHVISRVNTKNIRQQASLLVRGAPADFKHVETAMEVKALKAMGTTRMMLKRRSGPRSRHWLHPNGRRGQRRWRTYRRSSKSPLPVSALVAEEEEEGWRARRYSPRPIPHLHHPHRLPSTALGHWHRCHM